MMKMVEANWPLFAIAFVIGLFVAWWLFVALRRTAVRTDRSDVLDEGQGPAARNQALIDAPSTAVASQIPEPSPIEPVPAPTTQSGADDLSRIKGVGPKLKAMLISLGVTRFEQIANWSSDDIDRIDAQLGRFEGRIRRDSWTEQAKLLAADDMAAYEGKFGKL